MAVKSLASCLFCKIIKGDIPSYKLVETELSFSFLDIGPLSKGHSLDHAEKMHQLPDEYLADAIVVAKKIAIAIGTENYNILQNNGRIAHQEVDHVHFHIIPKPEAGDKEGLVVGWPAKSFDKEAIVKVHEDIMTRL